MSGRCAQRLVDPAEIVVEEVERQRTYMLSVKHKVHLTNRSPSEGAPGFPVGPVSPQIRLSISSGGSVSFWAISALVVFSVQS